MGLGLARRRVPGAQSRGADERLEPGATDRADAAGRPAIHAVEPPQGGDARRGRPLGAVLRHHAAVAEAEPALHLHHRDDQFADVLRHLVDHDPRRSGGGHDRYFVARLPLLLPVPAFRRGSRDPLLPHGAELHLGHYLFRRPRTAALPHRRRAARCRGTGRGAARAARASHGGPSAAAATDAPPACPPGDTGPERFRAGRPDAFPLVGPPRAGARPDELHARHGPHPHARHHGTQQLHGTEFQNRPDARGQFRVFDERPSEARSFGAGQQPRGRGLRGPRQRRARHLRGLRFRATRQGAPVQRQPVDAAVHAHDAGPDARPAVLHPLPRLRADRHAHGPHRGLLQFPAAAQRLDDAQLFRRRSGEPRPRRADRRLLAHEDDVEGPASGRPARHHRGGHLLLPGELERVPLRPDPDLDPERPDDPGRDLGVPQPGAVLRIWPHVRRERVVDPAAGPRGLLLPALPRSRARSRAPSRAEGAGQHA